MIVRAAVAQVIHVWTFMILAKPGMPRPAARTTTKGISAMILSDDVVREAEAPP